ncbi:hypothetical protein [Billgrantia antri]|uniref:hypothetical protein n=1 Tax=Billgrantia antri TaxID=2846777 RepID=UPI003B214880
MTLGEEKVTLAEKMAFLSHSATFPRSVTYPHAVARVEGWETHMSWVFLVGRRVYKLKKPIEYAARDGRRLRVREWLCREEVRLNRRLARTVYLGVVPLCMMPDGRLVLGGGGSIVDWLVGCSACPISRCSTRPSIAD